MKNSHSKQKHQHMRREYGAPASVRNVENQRALPGIDTDDEKCLKRFLLAIDFTNYGPKDRYVFDRSSEKWPCLVRLLGGECSSARGSRLVAAFKGVRGMQRHMRTVHKMDLLDYAKQWLRDNAHYISFDSDSEEGGSGCSVGREPEDGESFELLTSIDRERKRKRRKIQKQRKQEHERKKKKRMQRDADLSSEERAIRFNTHYYSETTTEDPDETQRTNHEDSEGHGKPNTRGTLISHKTTAGGH